MQGHLSTFLFSLIYGKHALLRGKKFQIKISLTRHTSQVDGFCGADLMSVSLGCHANPVQWFFFMNYVQSIIHEYIKGHIHVPLSADWLSCVLDEWICVFYMHPIVKLSTIIKECAVSNLQSVSNIFKDCIFFF